MGRVEIIISGVFLLLEIIVHRDLQRDFAEEGLRLCVFEDVLDVRGGEEKSGRVLFLTLSADVI